MSRDHVELPDDFIERAGAILDGHRASPVREDIRGEPDYLHNRVHAAQSDFDRKLQ